LITVKSIVERSTAGGQTVRMNCDKERTFAWMQRAYQEQSMMQYLKVHPFFDPGRDDPRFKHLVRRVGLN
jgi:hypothetical protein